MRHILCFMLLMAGAYAYAQDGLPGMVGNYDDFKIIRAQSKKQKNEFTFARLIYNGRTPGYAKNWYTDYPTGDANLVQVLRRLTGIDVAPESRAVPLHHPDLFNYPLIYSGEPGQIVFNNADARRMREYLDRGGFWIVDDFWGTYEWNSFEEVLKKIFPDREAQDLTLDHPVFHMAYDIDEILQVPNVGYAYCNGCPTWEEDGYIPHIRGIFDDLGNVQVLMLFNTDTMDASEWADDVQYPHRFSAYAYRLFINSIIYALTH